MNHASNSFKISAFTTSIIGGFNLFCNSLVGFAVSSNGTWCIHIEGLMLLMSAKVQPMIVLWSRNNFTNFFSCALVKPFAMIMRSVLLSPLNTYFKLSGNLILIFILFYFVKDIFLFNFTSIKNLFLFFMSIFILILFNLTFQSNIRFILCFNFDLYFFNCYFLFWILSYYWIYFFNFILQYLID